MSRCAWCPEPAICEAYASSACSRHARDSHALADDLQRAFHPFRTSDGHGAVVYNLSIEACDRDEGRRAPSCGWVPLAP